MYKKYKRLSDTGLVDRVQLTQAQLSLHLAEQGANTTAFELQRQYAQLENVVQRPLAETTTMTQPQRTVTNHEQKITWIIGLQALIIVTLFWVLVFYGKDEFEAYQGEHEEEIESPNLVSEKDGISMVKLTPETQSNSGISTSKIQSMSHQGSIKTFGSVLAIDKLIEAKTQYVALTTELNIAKSGSPQLQAQLQRLRNIE